MRIIDAVKAKALPEERRSLYLVLGGLFVLAFLTFAVSLTLDLVGSQGIPDVQPGSETPPLATLATTSPTPDDDVEESGEGAIEPEEPLGLGPVSTPRFAPHPGLWATWMADVSVPDLTRFGAGEIFTKTWRLKNTGSELWPEGTVLTFIGGDPIPAPDSVPVGDVASGEEVDVRVGMRAPRDEGVFAAEWALTTDGYVIPGSNVWVVIAVGEPAVQLREVRGPFELGGHIFQGMTYAEQMHHAGMTWVKVQARYPQDANLSEIIAAAHAQDFKILIGAVGDASLVTEQGYARRVADWMASMAAAGADAIEVWNEPNLPREWQEGYISPRAYTYLLCTAYSAIKGANRGTVVVSAAPAPTGYFNGCTSRGCDDGPWIEGLYEAEAARCFDYLGAHHNSGATAPSATEGHPADHGGRHHSWYFLPQTQLYYNTFHGKRQIFYTELGYVTPEGYGWIPDAFSWGESTSLGMQAQWLAEAARLSRETGMVRALIIWNVDATCYGECSGGQDPQAGYAIVRPGNVCPACETLHEVLNE